MTLCRPLQRRPEGHARSRSAPSRRRRRASRPSCPAPALPQVRAESLAGVLPSTFLIWTLLGSLGRPRTAVGLKRIAADPLRECDVHSAIDCDRLIDRCPSRVFVQSHRFDSGGMAMTTAASRLLGRPVWYELMTTDTRPPKRSTRTWWAGRPRPSKRRRARTRCSSAAATCRSPA